MYVLHLIFIYLFVKLIRHISHYGATLYTAYNNKKEEIEVYKQDKSKKK